VHDVLFDNLRFYPMTAGPEADGGAADPAASPAAAAGTCFAVTDGRFSAVGETVPASRRVDLGGRAVLPGFIDCHTHLVYAGDRRVEHARRRAGASYEEIAAAGGGILSTVRAVRAASEDELVDESLPRAAALLREGVTTLEIKSGYGLDLESELKMLRAARRIGELLPLTVRTTFLGAHTVPAGRDRADYLAEVVDVMLPAVAAEGLADAVDIFVESIAFGLDDLRTLAAAASRQGLPLRVHAEQLSSQGATALAAELGALSCDHLEYASPADVAAMAAAGTVAVLLPGAYYFLREQRPPPVAELRSAGVPMAVASDVNPGSSPIVSLLTNLHMAGVLFGLGPAEALAGVTQHAAMALGLGEDRGRIAQGLRADFTVWDLDDPGVLLYQLGGVTPAQVYVGGVPA
jgi:imidazolonepropionase